MKAAEGSLTRAALCCEIECKRQGFDAKSLEPERETRDCLRIAVCFFRSTAVRFPPKSNRGRPRKVSK
jgi:hypothetical protein